MTTKENYYDAAGLVAYSNSKPIALSYVSIFESLWKQGELYEQLKAYNMMQRDFINIAAYEAKNAYSANIRFIRGCQP